MRRERRFTNKTQILVIGVGGGGYRIIDQVIQQGGTDANFVCLDNDNELLSEQSASVVYVDWSDPHNEQNASKITESILPYLDGIHLLILVTTLGGTIGSNVTPIIAKAAQIKNVFTLALVTLPLSDEGISKADMAQTGLMSLRALADAVIALSLDRFMQPNGRSSSQAFLEAQIFTCWAIKAICKLLVPGQISIDSSALQTVLKTDGPIFLGGDCGSGSNRAKQAVQNAIDSPKMDLSIEGANNLLLQIHAGTELYLWEFTEIISHLKQQINSNANLIFGIIIDPDIENTLCLTILATGLNQNKTTG